MRSMVSKHLTMRVRRKVALPMAVVAAALVGSACATAASSPSRDIFVIPVASNIRASVVDMRTLYRSATGVRATIHFLWPDAQPGVGNELYDEIRATMEFDCPRHRFRTLSGSMHLKGERIREAKASARPDWEPVDEDDRESARIEAALCRPLAKDALIARTLTEARRIYEDRLRALSAQGVIKP